MERIAPNWADTNPYKPGVVVFRTGAEARRIAREDGQRIRKFLPFRVEMQCQLSPLAEVSDTFTFYRHFHRVWPHWFYFCDLDSEALTMMTMCLLPNLQGFKRLGEPEAAIEYDPMDLIDFISNNSAPLNTMMERAGMSETEIYNQTRDVFLHFKLPFDASSPEE